MEDNDVGYGRPLREIYRNAPEFECDHIDDIRPGERHAVLFEFPYKEPGVPKPHRGKRHYSDKDYVQLPCYSTSVLEVDQFDGGTTSESLWTKIELSLLREFDSSWQLQEAIKSYNSNIGNFASLHEYFTKNETTSPYFFTLLLPKIIKLALRLPDLIQTGIPLLKQSRNQSISLSQLQIACLLANAFLCTFPQRKSEDYKYIFINFNRLFESRGPQVQGKIECIINYFRRVCVNNPTGVLTFTRRSVKLYKLPNWTDIKEPIANTVLHIKSVGTIEDNGIGLLQVNSVNKYIGGGVLGGGCFQEEIRFAICPELIVSRLFTEFLKDNEALIIVGAEQFSSYTGYGHTFKFDKNFKDQIPIDPINRRRKTYIVAIDAYNFSKSSIQYDYHYIKRELNKAYVGFYHPLDTVPPGIASGNWGCGAFGGDSQLKALIQLMACTLTSRPLLYFTFGDKKLKKDIYEIYMFLIEKEINTGQLFKYLNEYKEHRNSEESLYTFIKRRHVEKKKSFFRSVRT